MRIDVVTIFPAMLERPLGDGIVRRAREIVQKGKGARGHVFNLGHGILPPTPVETLDRARQVALEEGVRYVYIGNVMGTKGSNTYFYCCSSRQG